MPTRLTKPVSRLVRDKSGHEIVVTLDFDAVTFRAPRTRSKNALRLPYALAFQRAGAIAGDSLLAARQLARSARRSAV